MKTYAVCGYGNRGQVYARELIKNNCKIVSVCDVSENRINAAKADCGQDLLCFGNEQDFFREKRADVLVIATMDRLHCRQLKTALEIGYRDIILEKPLSPYIDESKEMVKLSEQYNARVIVCHVLRYTPYYKKVHELIKQGVVGDIVNINHCENIGLGHYQQSFIRGNWSKKSESSSLILQKCCHDFDLLYWLTGKRVKRVSSFGSLYYFKKENQPQGAVDYCCDCKYRGECTYDCISIATWYKGEKSVEEATKDCYDKSKKVARCVFNAGNDVVDNQIVNMQYKDGSTASLDMSTFNNVPSRVTTIRGTKGDIICDLWSLTITYKSFDNKHRQDGQTILKISSSRNEHMGGDEGFIKDAVEFFETGRKTDVLSFITDTIESHLIAEAAEESRLHDGEVINLP